ncbi:TIGR01906 family membrane protein [Enterococcus columbae]|uniref:Integral membrane protein n=1 Tax=Enterococcus columbae DSM 7374 = ATCC 51263 TaxID=1121865 RepID=S0KPG2_9ENTE|nr:TIGR01906 family membrane protein [Enterococcus columbae]EOT41968.1 integral membrane protein [Enterococcus columbae DSM 7374 = ATCC 51263]EOW80525.1 integral membrane protein [Enterococcus columbae DSM 7374 = ATCC 51263]OJG26400.1 integral membrane protein [Enterococcus columbae DSM 7374 = ATCC 51263]
MKLKLYPYFEGVMLALVLLTILSFCIAFTINFTPLYAWNVEKYQLAQIANLSTKELLANYNQLLAYLNFPWQTKLVLPDFPMSSSGLKHFYEVKRLFLLDYIVFILGLVPSILYLKKLWQKRQLWKFLQPIQLLLASLVILCVLMLFGFDQFFVYFHQILFRNSDWLFDPATDPIINVLTEQFFMQCFLLFFLLLLISLAILYTIGRKQLKEK